ncbi:MAG TPA: hypothetical protein VLB82_09955 [Thermodesulfobacteriota bacterium]|nr:hypothetical protein [Thermodesulfobacteriota bacterium]
MKAETIRKQISNIRLDIFTAITKVVSEFEKKELVVALENIVIFEEGESIHDSEKIITELEYLETKDGKVLSAVIDYDCNKIYNIPLKDLSNDMLLDILQEIEMSLKLIKEEDEQ